MSTAPPTTPAPTSVAPTTVAPSTVAPTTVVPTTTLTTAAPTTTLTTGPPTTVPPTTVPPIEIDAGPINLYFNKPYSVLHYNPPAPVNSGLDQTWDFGAIEISFSYAGYVSDIGIEIQPINIYITPLVTTVSIGYIIDQGAINIVISLKPTDVLVGANRCNFVKWSKIGYLDFTIDESNLAGERPLDWTGCVYHVHKLGSAVAAYGVNGVSILKPSGVHFGLNTIYRIGLKNKGAFAGDDDKHFFVDSLNQLFKLSDKLAKLDYSEYISTLGTTILTFDKEKNLLYICDGTNGFVYSDDTGSFGEGPPTITGIGSKGTVLYAASDGTIVTPKFEICTDIYDLGTRKRKTIRTIEVGSEPAEYIYASVDYRTSHRETFRQIGWTLVNPSGKAFVKCYGVEFRFKLMSSIYEYFEVDYLKVRGHIHGFSYLDTVSRTISSEGQV